MWTICKVFIEFITILLLLFMFWFFWPQGMWDLCSPTRDQTYIPCIGRQSHNHWTVREVPNLFKIKYSVVTDWTQLEQLSSLYLLPRLMQLENKLEWKQLLR